MKLNQFSKTYSRQLRDVAALMYFGVWQAEATDVLKQAEGDIQDTHQLLHLMHRVQRLHVIQSAGLGNNQGFKDAYFKERANMPLWQNFNRLEADIELQHSLAKKLYNIRPGKNDVGLLNLGEYSYEIGKWLADTCLAGDTPFVVNFGDPAFMSLVVSHADNTGIQALAAAYIEVTKPVTRIMTARPNTPEREFTPAPVEKSRLYSVGVKAFSERISSGELYYTLTTIPTKKDAKIDHIPYDDYIKLYFEMCDQPWSHVSRAQQSLIEEFNAASHVRITNNDGTDISMELVDADGSHFTFCNSLIAKNVPGSEIFSAPRRDSVNGKIVAKGRFGDAGEIVNLTMEFENGHLIRYNAEEGLKAFEDAIGIDEGARYVGELGIGTNPHLRQHVANGLLVEKIGGSFHLALGRPYTYTEYEGVPVKVDNGNKSSLHWDITTMLHGKEGRIYLDGRLVMDNGEWLDKKYDILNRGWAAVPEAERPDYWKKKLNAPKV